MSGDQHNPANGAAHHAGKSPKKAADKNLGKSVAKNATKPLAAALPLATRLRYWPTGIQLVLMRLIALLPLRGVRAVGAMLGDLLWPVARERRHITLRNLELCFPDKTEAEREQLARANFRNTAIGFMETAKVWFSTPAQLTKHVEIEGLEHLHAAAAKGKGVLVLAFHLTDLELGAVALAQHCQLAGMYRPHADPVFERAMRSGRERHFPLIPRDDVRAMMRWLKQGGCVWYAADQDYGLQHSVFAPFFGMQAATITATSRFAKLSGATVVPFTHVRTPAGIKLSLHAPLERIPSGDERADATMANAFLEHWLRQHPANYLWLHRRFKSRPPGEPSPYPKRKARLGQNEISGQRFDQLLKQARVLKQDQRGRPLLIETAKGKHVWLRYRGWWPAKPSADWNNELALIAPEWALTIERIQHCPARHCEVVSCARAETVVADSQPHSQTPSA